MRHVLLLPSSTRTKACNNRLCASGQELMSRKRHSISATTARARATAASSDSEALTLASQDASCWDFCMRRIRLRHHAAAHDHRHSSTDFQAMRGRMRMCTRDATDAATAFKLQASTQASATYIASMAVPAPSCMLVGIKGSITAKNKDCYNGRLARSRRCSLLASLNSVGFD